MKNNGKIVSVEGIDGSGKTDVCEFISSFLSEKKINHVLTKECSDIEFAQDIKNIIFNHKNLTNKTELLLFLANRAQHLHDFVIPNVNEGNFVVIDRFIDSTIAYQGYGNEYPISFINNVINMIELDQVIPDLTILLDIPVEVAISRIKNRKQNNSFDEKNYDFFNRVREGYLKLSLIYNDRIEIVNANQDFESVCLKVKELIKKII